MATVAVGQRVPPVQAPPSLPTAGIGPAAAGRVGPLAVATCPPAASFPVAAFSARAFSRRRILPHREAPGLSRAASAAVRCGPGGEARVHRQGGPSPPRVASTEALTAEEDTTSASPGLQLDGSDVASPEEASAKEAGSFVWTSNWYCIGAVLGLDPSRPHPVTILGKRLVLWRDPRAADVAGEGAATGWRCFQDRCPHRLVPLSEGRISEGGDLQCSYHGWTFNGEGRCTGIPQAASTGPEREAVGSPRACAVAFPVWEEQGLLFVWPEAGPEAAARAAATPPPMPRGVVGAKQRFKLSTFTRELEYGYDLLAENVMDPSHLPFSHHGIGTLRRENALPYKNVAVASKLEGPQGYVGRYFDEVPGVVFVEFQAPSLFVYQRVLDQSPEYRATEGGVGLDPDEASRRMTSGELGPWHITALFVTPVAPGRSRLTTLQGSNKPSKPSFLFTLFARFPFVGHLFMHNVLDGDSFFLHAQEKAIQGWEEREGTAVSSGRSSGVDSASAQVPPASKPSLVSSAYFVPTNADRFVIAFRQWLDRFAGPVPWPAEYSSLSPNWSPKEQVLSRWAGHTAGCSECQKALSFFKSMQIWLRVAAVVLLVLATARGIGWVPRVACVALGCAGAWGSWAVEGIIEKFLYVGYDHASRP